jgi:NADP-dependent 3-hydroxy acid dehydrogenase YdfG
MAKVIMISGASRGIGKAIAVKLYEHGFLLSLGIRNWDTIDADILRLNKDKVLLAAYNATDPNTENDWVQQTHQAFHRIDGLINNAGVYHSLDIEEDNEELLNTMLDINTKAPIRLTRLVLPYLRQAGEGRIINIVSDGGKRVEDSKVGYSISKFGSLAASHAMLHASKKDGVRVTALCPGWVNTDMAKNTSPLSPEKMIQPETIADIVLMLLNLPNTVMIPELLVDNP